MIIPAVETASVRGVSFVAEFDRSQLRIRRRMNALYFLGLLCFLAFAMLLIFGIDWLIWRKINESAVSGAVSGCVAPIVVRLTMDRKARHIIRLLNGRISLDRPDSALWDSALRRISPKHPAAGKMGVADAGPVESARVVVRRFAIWYAVCVQSADERGLLQGMIWHCLLRSDAEHLAGVIREFLHPCADGTTWPPAPASPEARL